jgi:hypothetical protein
MGCEICVIAQKRVNNEWEDIKGSFLQDQNYGVFGFLANVRNYSGITPISKPRKLPTDYKFEKNVHRFWRTKSWLLLSELSSFDYDQMMEDRRVERLVDGLLNGGCTRKPGEGKIMTYREFFGKEFFKDLKRLKYKGAERIVFGFSE